LFDADLALVDADLALFDADLALFGIDLALFDVDLALFGIDLALFDADLALFDADLALFDVDLALFGIDLALFGIDLPLVDTDRASSAPERPHDGARRGIEDDQLAVVMEEHAVVGIDRQLRERRRPVGGRQERLVVLDRAVGGVHVDRVGLAVLADRMADDENPFAIEGEGQGSPVDLDGNVDPPGRSAAGGAGQDERRVARAGAGGHGGITDVDTAREEGLHDTHARRSGRGIAPNDRCTARVEGGSQLVGPDENEAIGATRHGLHRVHPQRGQRRATGGRDRSSPSPLCHEDERVRSGAEHPIGVDRGHAPQLPPVSPIEADHEIRRTSLHHPCRHVGHTVGVGVDRARRPRDQKASGRRRRVGQVDPAARGEETHDHEEHPAEDREDAPARPRARRRPGAAGHGLTRGMAERAGP
jgi:hypothetical protein